MISLAGLTQKYPLISIAEEKDQEKIFALLDRTAIHSGGLQVAFERRPDFFRFLENQGPHSFVFLMHNEDRSVHGLACLSIRPMHRDGRDESIVYGSDLRTDQELCVPARRQWRECYAEIIANLPALSELQNSSVTLTAVWNDNQAAQRALVRKNAKLKLEYEPIASYTVISVLGRLWRRRSKGVRPARPEDHETILKWMCAPGKAGAISWTEAELQRTLQRIGKNLSDFLVLERNSRIEAFALPADSMPGRKVILRSLPKSLQWLAILVRILFRIKITMGAELRTTSILFFHQREDLPEVQNYSEFLHYLINREKRKRPDERAHVFTISTWKGAELTKHLLKKGFLNTSLGAKVYQVLPLGQKPAQNFDLQQLEVGLL
jgi:hypothetical protein